MTEHVPVESASAILDARIRELGDWRGKMLAKVRDIIHGKCGDRRDVPQFHGLGNEGETTLPGTGGRPFVAASFAWGEQAKG